MQSDLNIYFYFYYSFFFLIFFYLYIDVRSVEDVPAEGDGAGHDPGHTRLCKVEEEVSVSKVEDEMSVCKVEDEMPVCKVEDKTTWRWYQRFSMRQMRKSIYY